MGRLYIDGKQKISSSGTTNLDDAIPILEKWFDDVHEESKKLKIEENIKPKRVNLHKLIFQQPIKVIMKHNHKLQVFH